MKKTFEALSFLVILLFCSTRINALPASVKIPSGRTIPLPLLTEHFPSLSTAHATKQLYEITSNFQIIGHDLNVSINSVTGEPELIRHKPRSIIFNGQKLKSAHLHVHIRRGRFRVAHTPDGTVLGVWGPRLSLQPIDLVNSPGLYVNMILSNSISTTEADEYSQVTPTENQDVVGSSRLRSHIENDEESRHQSLPALSRKATCEKKSKSKMVEVAVAFSSRQCKKYGSFGNTITALLALFTLASEPYEYQTCLFLKVVTFDGYCSPSGDPYRSYKSRFTKEVSSTVQDDPEKHMISSFALFWHKNRKFVKRDLAFFMPAFDSPGSTGGQAFLGGVCSKHIGYGWASPIPTVITHEIGHSFNASHSHAGIMSSQINEAYPPEYFMTSSANTISRYAETRKCLGGRKGTSLKTEQTCGFKFPEQLGFKCKTTKLPTFSWKRGVSVEKMVTLAGGKITISLNIKTEKSITTQFRFKRIMIHASTDDRLAESKEMKNFPSIRSIRTNSPRFRKNVSASGLEAKSGWSTCCGKSVSIYVYVEIETYKSTVSWSGEASQMYNWKLSCTSCATRILPMSETRKCPSCSKHDPRLKANKTGSK